MKYVEIDEKLIQSFEYETTIQSENNGSILGVCELGKASIQLINEENNYSSYKGSWIRTIHGSFYIYDVAPVQERVNIKLDCYDIKYKLDTPYDSSKHIFPCTLKEWRNSIFDDCGVEYNNSDFPNSDLLLETQPYVGDVSNRAVISLIAQAGASTVVTDNLDCFYFDWFSNIIHIAEDWSNLTTEKEYSLPVNCIVLGRGNVEDNVFYPEIKPTNPVEFRIDNNYILDPQDTTTNEDKRYTTRVPIYNRLNGFKYLIFDIKSTSITNKLSIKLGQKIKYTDIWDNELEAYIMTKKINWLGGSLEDDNNYEITLSAKEIKETSTEFSYSSSIQNDILRVERKADKNAGKIEDLIVEEKENTKKINKLEMTADETKQTISKVETTIEDITTPVEIVKSNNDLHIENALEKDALEYIIEGKSEQVQTEQSDNLLDPDFMQEATVNGITLAKTNRGTYLLNGTATENAFFSNLFKKSLNDSNSKYNIRIYRLSAANTTTGNVTFTIYNNDYSKFKTPSISPTSAFAISSLDNSVEYVRGVLSINKGVTVTNCEIGLAYMSKDITTTLASWAKFTSDSPSPEYPSEIKNIKGISNLTNYDNDTNLDHFYISNTGVMSSDTSTLYTAEKINVKPNKQYTLNFESIVGKSYIRLCEFDKNDTFIKRTLINTKTTFTTNSNTSYVVLNADKGDTKYFTKLILVEGSVADFYFSYNTQWLLVKITNEDSSNSILIDMNKYDSENNIIGSYELNSTLDLSVRDNLKIADGEVTLTKRVGKIILDGSQTPVLATTFNNTTRFAFDGIISSAMSTKNARCSSDYFTWYENQSSNLSFNSVDTEAIHIRDDGKGFGIKINKSIASTVNELKTFLSNNPITIYYPLKNEEYITLPSSSIKLFEGINNIYLNSDIETDTSIKYLKNSPGGYATRNELNTTQNDLKSEIKQTADSIKSEVSGTYSTKEEVSEAKTAAINSANNNTTEKLKSYSTTTQMNTAIEQKVNDKTATIESKISTAKTEAITSANTSTDNKLKNYSTTTQMNNAIIQKITDSENSINLKIDKKVNDKDYTAANIILKINEDESESKICADKITLTAGDILNLLAGNSINLSSKNITIESDKFSVNAMGKVNASDIEITGGSISIDSPYKLARIILTATNENHITAISPGGYRIQRGSDTNNYISVEGYNTNDWFMQMRCNLNESINISAGPTLGTAISVGNSLTDQYTNILASGIFTPSVTQTSKEEYKKNFELLENALDIVKNTDIYKYNLKNQDDSEKKHIGFVIGDKYRYSKEITSIDKDGQDVGADIYSMISVCFKAIQEQQIQIEKQQEQIDKLKEEIKLLKEKEK